MSPTALTNATPWVAAHDFTGDSNHLMLGAESDALDSTTFASGGWQEFTGGLKKASANLAGFWSSALSDSVDSEVFNNLGVGGEVVTISPSGTALDAAYMFQATKLKYEIGDEVGKLAPFSLDMSGSTTAGLVRGQVAKARGTVSGTGVLGSGLQLGAVAAGKALYGALHLLGTAGTSITLVIESDDNSGFASAATVATVGPLTTVGGTWTKVSGAITDSYFRYRVTAITGTWLVAAALGIA